MVDDNSVHSVEPEEEAPTPSPKLQVFKKHATKIVTFLLIGLFFYLTVFALVLKDALPGGNLFSILLVFVTCKLLGVIAGFIRLPPLVGMLLGGLILGNIPRFGISSSIDSNWSIALRNIAFVTILIRAGLGLDAKALIRLKRVCFMLSCIPGCMIEAPIVALLAHFILKFPLGWSFMLGFILAAVSPAVVVPGLLPLQDKGYGVDKGVPTLIIAAASFDDIVAISCFSLALGVTMSTGEHLLLVILHAPAEIFSGVLLGAIIGRILWLVPSEKSNYVVSFRLLLIFFASTAFVFVSNIIKLAGAGPLGCLTAAFIAGMGWKEQKAAVETHLNTAWQLLMPLLFGLIGVQVNLYQLDLATVGFALIIIFVGLFFRVLTTYFCCSGVGFRWQEKLFVAIAWLPKATVQAAIGSIPFDKAIQYFGKEDPRVQTGLQILTIAVMAILLTAPLGAIAVSFSGQRLLKKNPSIPNGKTIEASGSDHQV